MRRGKLIFLNGVTSTGKSTVAEWIRDMSRDIFYTSSNDIFHGMVSWNHFDGSFWKLVAHTIAAQYHAVRGMLDGGFNVIIDGMFLDLPEYRELFGKSNIELFSEIFADYDTMTVNLTCLPEELRRRNRVRGNRGEGQSDEQLSLMTTPLEFDMTIDVMTTLPDECAELILEHAGLAYDRLPLPKRERRRAQLLYDLLKAFEITIEPSVDENASFVKYSSVMENTITVSDADSIHEIVRFLLERGYCRYPKKCSGFTALQRMKNGKVSDILRIQAKDERNITDLTALLGKEIAVVVDRPLGEAHPHHPDLIYEVNYGYIPDTLAGDGEEADAYILGADHPVRECTGTAAAVIHRFDDSEEKLIVVPKGITMHPDEILSAVNFAEQYFHSVLYLPK